jgi:rhodanese-related sulfurtransferase
MNKKIIRSCIILFGGYFLVSPRAVHAVIPPDFIFNIGVQVAQFFSITIIFFTAIFGAFFQFFKTAFRVIKYKKIVAIIAIVSVISIASVTSYFYAMHAQTVEYQKWLEESQVHDVLQNNNPSSDVASLPDHNEQGTSGISYVPVAENVATNNTTPQEADFFANNAAGKLLLTNQEFKTAIGSGRNDFIVLDARENIEYENGYFPGSLHIRAADLRDGRWAELPKDKFIYVICWSGIRGKEVAEFLRTKALVVSYLENGANGWVEFGGEWVGGIKFLEKYTDEIKKMVGEGVVLVDTREPDKFQKWHIAGSVNIPIMHTPTNNFKTVFAQIPAKSKFVAICDGYVNCFDAKITGVELEKAGHQFLGRYNKPWEYEK